MTWDDAINDGFKLLAVAALFLALGFNYGTWTSRLPALKAALDLSTSQVSVLLLCAALTMLRVKPPATPTPHR